MIEKEAFKKSVVIVIIDSGINSCISDLSKYIKKETGFKINDNGVIVEDMAMPIKHEHGTLIALIIRHICPKVELISINILNERLATDGRVLIYALEKALEYKPNIIHLSLGTTKKRYKWYLNNIIKRARKTNIIIVSAANNEGIRSYPAYLKGVIGVKTIDRNYRENHYDGKFYYILDDAQNIRGVNELKNKSMTGNSISAAFITGYIAFARLNEKNQMESLNKLIRWEINDG